MKKKSKNLISKITTAEKLLDEFKSNILDILWDSEKNIYFNERWLIPFIAEETEYKIKSLGFNSKYESKYLQKIDNYLGEYYERI